MSEPTVEEFKVTGTEVMLSISITKNLGNFENVKMQESIKRNLREGEHPKQAFQRLYDVTSESLSNLLDQATRELKG